MHAMISEDDGRTWSETQLIGTVIPAQDASCPREKSGCPSAFERRPGEPWLTARRFGGFRARPLGRGL